MKRLLFLALLPMLLAGCEPNQDPNEEPLPPHFAPSIYWVMLSEAGLVNSTFEYVGGKSADGVLEGISVVIDIERKYDYPFVLFNGKGALSILERTTTGRLTSYNLDEYPSYEDIELFPTKQQLYNLKSQSVTQHSPELYIFSALKNFTITADKSLWGVEAGSNLIDVFEFCNGMPRIDCQTFEIFKENIKTHSDGTYEVVTLEQLKGSLLPEYYVIRPKRAHEERYDQVTFCVTIESEVEDTTITRTQTFVVNF